MHSVDTRDTIYWYFTLCFYSDSPYRDKISSIILKLQEDQTIQRFYNMWWKEKNKDGECIDSTQKKTNALTIKNVGGIFVVLIAGTMAGAVVAFFEFLWKARKNAKEDKVSTILFDRMIVLSYNVPPGIQ